MMRNKTGLVLAMGCALGVSLAGTTSVNAAPIPLLHYTFDEASGPALDSGSGDAANGTFSGSATRTTDTPGALPGRALSIAGGTTDYVTSGDANKLDQLQQFTLTTWINLRGGPAQFDRLLSDHDATGGWDLFIENPSGGGGLSAGSFALSLTVDTGTGANSANLSADNEWLFIAVTYDGTLTENNVRFYAGDVSTGVATAGDPKTMNKGTTDANNADFRIGATARTASDRTPVADFDDVRVYGDVLTPAELESIRLANVPEPTSALMALSGAGLAMLARRGRPAESQAR